MYCSMMYPVYEENCREEQGEKDLIYPLIWSGRQGLSICHIFAYSLSINLSQGVDTEILKGAEE